MCVCVSMWYVVFIESHYNNVGNVLKIFDGVCCWENHNSSNTHQQYIDLVKFFYIYSRIYCITEKIKLHFAKLLLSVLKQKKSVYAKITHRGAHKYIHFILLLLDVYIFFCFYHDN